MIQGKVTGLADYTAALRGVVPKLRRGIVLKALRAAARPVRDEARRNTPILSTSNLLAPYRKPGTVRRAIAVRTSKESRKRGAIGVFVNVRPLPGAKGKVGKLGRASAKNPNDPFYWRFINFDIRSRTGDRFLEKGAKKLGEALKIFEETMAKEIAKLNDKQPR